MLVALLSMLLSDPSAAVDGPISRAEINAAATKVRGFKPRDEFDSPPGQPAWAGRTFQITLPVFNSKITGIACFGSPIWEYSAETQTLYIAPGGSDLALLTFRGRQGVISKGSGADTSPVRYYATDCKRLKLPTYTASNAYGAAFHIEPTSQIITAIADDAIRPEWPATFELRISGSEARALANHLGVRLTGTLSDWKAGVAMACDVRHDGPRADSPYDRTRDLCIANGRIDKFEIIDNRDGHVIHSESRPSASK